jgi:ribose 5-phosphate isomerase B
MSDANKETRERIKSLVRQVLDSVPSAEGRASNAGAPLVEHVVVNSLKDSVGKPFDRDESSKPLITEDDLRGLQPGARLRIAENAKFTSLAEDTIRDCGIELVRKESRNNVSTVRSVAVGSDHGGFKLKEVIKDLLSDLGVLVRDFGTDSELSVDYPDFAHAVARAVGAGQVDVGVIIDGAGIGSAMTANKVPNVRAAACYSVALAKNSREHNGANVLTLGAGQNTADEARKIVEAFISTELLEERHKKRVSKIDNIERQYRK